MFQDVKFYPDNMDPVVCFFMTSYMYGQVLLTSGSQVHVCCKLVTCDSSSHLSSNLVWPSSASSNSAKLIANDANTKKLIPEGEEMFKMTTKSKEIIKMAVMNVQMIDKAVESA